MKWKLTVQEVLQRTPFTHAVVEAGEGGLSKEIRWVHILEITNAESLIHGGELILSTGIGLKSDPVCKLTYLKQLISLGAAGLCIELGQYVEEIPEEMKDLANQYNFPLISFRQTVRFVEITEDLHSLIVERRAEWQEIVKNEEKQLMENSWLVELVHNQLHNEDDLRHRLGWQKRKGTGAPLSTTICVIDVIEEDNHSPEPFSVKKEMLSISAALKLALHESKFQCSITRLKNQLVIMIYGFAFREHLNDVLSSPLLQLQQMYSGRINLGVGRTYYQLVESHKAYKEALLVLQLKSRLPHISCFYTETGIYRLLLQVSDSKVTQVFVEDCLKQVIQYDQENGANLLRTLKIYLEHIDSKQQAAKELYIHRQTFYQRLDKLKELLGEKFMEAEQRLSLEIALRGYELLYGKIEK